ncbi:Ldh family oxidoreductase [Pseudoroseicyclus sp. CXY001]|uniref:Ldh family oxidoreductase n=1 Tax=Pseudoroseicyclus sp. CXY001 TaxID=3242492 RepID=UPI00358DCD46
MLIEAEDLRGMMLMTLRKRGAPEAHAALQAEVLMEAELRALPSHGAQRLPRLVSRIDRGLADPAASGAHVWARGGFLAIDGQRGLGPVVIEAATAALGEAARRHGIALAAIRNANHIGMLSFYAERAAGQGLIAIVLSTSEALVHPFGGTEAMLGTNPVAIGIPTEAGPFVVDLATSAVSMGKIHHHALTVQAIPDGWAVDAEGNPTTDAEAAKAGAIAPFGGAKGYGLGLAFELLVAALAGSAFAPEVRGTLDDLHPANKGDVVILIDPGARDGEAGALAGYLERLRQSRPAEPGQPVRVPGDGARARRQAALQRGIELPDALYDTLLRLAAA